MPLVSPPQQFVELNTLVDLYNKLSPKEAIQRLFYLQKINYELNQLDINASLYEWMSDESRNGWLAQLAEFKINRFASFTLKSMQFAQEVASHLEQSNDFESENVDFYQLQQERDNLIKEPVNSSTFQHTIEKYCRISAQLNHIVLTDERIKHLVEKQLTILKIITPKLLAIQGKNIDDMPDLPLYFTKELGEHVNNINYTLVTDQWDAPFVIRVEDRSKFGLDQELYSFEASKYFLEDYAVFMLETRLSDGAEEGVVYRPITLSQFANQSNLQEVVKKMRGTNPKYIGPQIAYYFEQIIDFSLKLVKAKAYFPDIKLTNFLAHNGRVLVSDRKTITTDKSPYAKDVRSTPNFAPDEYYKCINLNTMTLKYWAHHTQLNMPQFMAYQVGMALKVALTLSQVEELPENFREQEIRAGMFFDSPPRIINNLSLLAQELMRTDPAKRLTLEHAASLMPFRNYPTSKFMEKIEEFLPSAQLGIDQDINTIHQLMDSGLSGHALLTKASPLLLTISQLEPKEPRLSFLAEQLAAHCFLNASKPFYLKLSQAIEKGILEMDWNKAPWYRKALHWLSFGYFRVDRVTEVEEIFPADINPNQKEMTLIANTGDLMKAEIEEHLSETRYIPSNFLIKEMGVYEAGNLEDFIYNFLERKTKIQKDSLKLSEETVGHEKDTALSPGEKLADELSAFDSQGMVVHEDEPEQAPMVQLEKTIIVIEDSTTNGTKTKDPRLAYEVSAQKTGRKQSFFGKSSEPSKESKPATESPKEASKTKEVDFIPDLMFLGDCGSRNQRSRRKKASSRTHVSEINWSPPTDGEHSESLQI